jgi:hypothetical protein
MTGIRWTLIALEIAIGTVFTGLAFSRVCGPQPSGTQRAQLALDGF